MNTLFNIAATGIIGLSLAGCGGSHEEKPSKTAGVWQAPAYGKVWNIQEVPAQGAINSAYDRNKNNSDFNHKFNSTFIATQYDVTSTTCLKNTLFPIGEDGELTEDELLAVFILQDDETTLEHIQIGQSLSPGIIFSRIDSLPEACIDNLTTVKGNDDYTFDAERDFSIFWQTMNELYFDFDLSQTDWQSTYSEFAPLIAFAEDEEDLFSIFSEMVEPLEDGHTIILRADLSQGIDSASESDESDEFSVSYKPSLYDRLVDEFIEIHQLTPPFTSDDIEALDDFIDEQADILSNSVIAHAENLDYIGQSENGDIAWFKTEENVGYILVDSMSGLGGDDDILLVDKHIAAQAIDQALVDLSGVEGIIIDIRLNGGGEDEVSLVIASRFSHSSQHVYSKQARLGNIRTPLQKVYLEPLGELQFLGPVVLLTSENTFSAAEVFALAMRELPNVTLIGEASGGSFSDILVSRVSSDIAFGFSNEFYLSTTGEWFEREGVPVDIEVPFATKEQRDNEEDLGFERAIEFLGQR